MQKTRTAKREVPGTCSGMAGVIYLEGEPQPKTRTYVFARRNFGMDTAF